jgi:hypothetical protein
MLQTLQVVSPSQSTSGVSAINPLVAIYEILARKVEVILLYFVLDAIRDTFYSKLATRPGFARVQC